MKNEMKIGSSTLYSLLSKKPAECVRELSSYEINTIELVYEYPHFYPEKEIGELISLGRDYSMHCPFVALCFVHQNPSIRKLNKKLITRSLEAADKLNATHYVMHGGVLPRAYQMIDKTKTRKYFLDVFIREFKNAFSKANDAGIKVLIENMNKGQLFDDPADIIYLKEKMPFVGLCYDIGHGEIQGQREELLALKPDHIHVSDNDLKIDSHLPVGWGSIDFDSIFSSLRKSKFSGKVILECRSLKDTFKSYRKLLTLLP